jgi:3-phosphoshikimate 1-carboxyvinyltransferase
VIWRIRPSILGGTATVPGDKSLGHRALMLAALARGRSTITNLPDGDDVQSTARCLAALGVDIRKDGAVTVVQSIGAFRPPTEPLDCGNSGTTMRLLTGILAGQPFRTTLIGDDSLSRRPMRRVIDPLRQMGARIASDSGCAPLHIDGAELHGVRYTLPVASAQIKSAVLLAGLFASGETVVVEPASLGRSRDHTETMLRALGAAVRVNHPSSDATGAPEGWNVSVTAGSPLVTFDISIPGDPSSAAFLMAGACLTGGTVTIDDILINPTRTGFLRALVTMGARVDMQEASPMLGEPRACVSVSGTLKSCPRLQREDVPQVLDELPLLALCATQTDGVSEIRHAAELRVKETDRIQTTTQVLTRMGAEVKELNDGFMVQGPTPLHGAVLPSQNDHRIAMMLAVAGLSATGETMVHGAESASVSWPGFQQTLAALGGDIVTQ